MQRSPKGKHKLLNPSISIREDVIEAVYKYMKDGSIRNRSAAIETLLIEVLKQKGYME